MRDGRTWRWISLAGIFAMLGLWAAAIVFGWVHSVVLVNHLSFASLVVAFGAMWRSDEK